jgi:hypothetical protein
MTLCTYGHRFSRTPKPGEVGDLLQVDHWLSVFTTEHDFDAHAWPYVRYFDDELAPAVRARSTGGRVETDGLFLCGMVFLDYDASNDHATILDRLQQVPEDHYLYRAAAIYPTKSGMRLVYRLSEPVLTEDYPALVRGMAMDLVHFTGLQLDPTTDQWSRCFRLPKVTRDDEKAKGPTWQEPYYFDALISEEASINPSEVKPRAHRLPWDSRGRTTQQAEEKRPANDDDLPESRKKLYARVLKSSRFRDYIFEDARITQGRRDQTLLAMSGEVVRKCFKAVPESSAEEIYCLMTPVIMEFTQDGEPWQDKLWRMVRHSWNEEAKKEADRQQQEAADKTQRDVITEEMIKQLPADEVPNGDPERRDYLQRHYCLQTAAGCYVVARDGQYLRHALKPQQLPAHFNDELHCLVEGGFRTRDGKPMSGYEIMNRYSTNIDDVQFVADRDVGVRLCSLGNKRLLRISPFGIRKDLLDRAEYDPDIADWLETFHDSNTLKRWLASALALDRGPTAACYLYGPARVGKSMLAMAIAECFGSDPVPGQQAFSDFNGRLLESPVVMVDEGLPIRLSGSDTADVFRSLVTGSAVSTQKKFMDQITSSVPYRVIFSANSFDMVRTLVGKRTLATQDREAFRERILVIETGQRPADFLDSRGAMTFTRESARGSWLGGECRLARHLIKLYLDYFCEQQFARDGRMLVQGKPHQAFTLSFDLSGMGREVVDELTSAISRVYHKKAAVDLYRSVEIVNGCVWIKKRPFTKFAISASGASRAEAFATALDRFLTNFTRTSPTDLTTQVMVDMDKLIFCAANQGLSIADLTALRLTANGVS